MSRIRALGLSLALAFLGLVSSAFAEGSAATIDLSAAEGFASTLGTALVTFVTGTVIPAVLLIVGAVASLLLIYRIIRWGFRALGGR